MTEATMYPATKTIGIDLGDRKSHICVLDETGEVVEESRIQTRPKALEARFQGMPAARIALEVGVIPPGYPSYYGGSATR